MRRMTITEALAELKLLDARIAKATFSTIWCVCEANTKATTEYVEKLTNDTRASWQSVNALIEERAKIKSAIVKSNAVTEITIGSRTMTVAEAIERKSSIGYEKALAEKVKEDFAKANANCEGLNARVQTRLDNLLQNLSFVSNEGIAEAQKAVAENFMAQNGYKVIDPLDINDKVADMTARVEDFDKNVDVALSVSNAIAFIEV